MNRLNKEFIYLFIYLCTLFVSKKKNQSMPSDRVPVFENLHSMRKQNWIVWEHHSYQTLIVIVVSANKQVLAKPKSESPRQIKPNKPSPG